MSSIIIEHCASFGVSFRMMETMSVSPLEILICDKTQGFLFPFQFPLVPAIMPTVPPIVHEVVQSCVKHKPCSFPASSDCLRGLCIAAPIAGLMHRYAPMDMNELLSAWWMSPCFTSADPDSKEKSRTEFTRMNFRETRFLRFAAVPGCSFPRRPRSVRIEPGMSRRTQATAPLLSVWNRTMMQDVRLFLSEGLNDLTSVPLDFLSSWPAQHLFFVP